MACYGPETQSSTFIGTCMLKIGHCPSQSNMILKNNVQRLCLNGQAKNWEQNDSSIAIYCDPNFKVLHLRKLCNFVTVGHTAFFYQYLIIFTFSACLVGAIMQHSHPCRTGTGVVRGMRRHQAQIRTATVVCGAWTCTWKVKYSSVFYCKMALFNTSI